MKNTWEESNSNPQYSDAIATYARKQSIEAALLERSAITTANSIKRSHSRLGLFYAPPLCNLGRNERKWSAHSAFGRYPPPIIPDNSPTSRHIRVCTVTLLTRLVALRLLVKTNNLISAPLQFRTSFHREIPRGNFSYRVDQSIEPRSINLGRIPPPPPPPSLRDG